MNEARGDELHLGAATGEGRRERVVVGAHVPGWIDQLNAHAVPFSRPVDLPETFHPKLRVGPLASADDPVGAGSTAEDR